MIKYIPLDYVKYCLDLKPEEGYILKIDCIQRVIIYNPHTCSLIKTDITKILELLNRQIPFGKSTICNRCAIKDLEMACDCCDYRIKTFYPLSGVFANFLINDKNICCTVKEIFLGLGEFYGYITESSDPCFISDIIKYCNILLSIPKPKNNLIKDGTIEGLNYILENQRDHKLWEYLTYRIWSQFTGNISLIYHDINQLSESTINTGLGLFLHTKPCEYCIYQGSSYCIVKDCVFYNNNVL